MKVRDLMTTDPVTTTPDAPLKEAARLMVKHKVSGLPVCRDGKVVGMVTEGDFLRQEANRDQPYRFGLLDAIFGASTAAPSTAAASSGVSRLHRSTGFAAGPCAPASSTAAQASARTRPGIAT